MIRLILIALILIIGNFNYGLLAQDTSAVKLGIPPWAEVQDVGDNMYPVHTFDLNVFAEHLPVSFSSYRNQIEDYNIDLLNSAQTFFGFNFQDYYNNWMLGVDIGFSKYQGEHLDSLHLSLNGLMGGISFGYQLIYRENWEFIPLVSARWFRYRLMNSNIIYDIPLGQHLEDRDLDLRFNQGTGFLGGKFNFKIPQPYEERLININIGVYAGYQFKLHPSTLLYSRRNQLDAGGGTIKYDGIFAGIYFGVRLS